MRSLIAGGIAAILVAGTAMAQVPVTNAPNAAINTSSIGAAAPAKGANSFTLGEARHRLTAAGFSHVNSLRKDADGVWRGRAERSGQPVSVWLDYRGKIGQE